MNQPTYLETNLPIPEQVQDLLSRLTLDEQVAMRHYFPQAIGMAATWDKDLIHQIASAISDEGRATYHYALRRNGYLEVLSFASRYSRGGRTFVQIESVRCCNQNKTPWKYWTQWTFRPLKNEKIPTKTHEMDVLEAVENEALESHSSAFRRVLLLSWLEGTFHVVEGMSIKEKS